MNHSSHSSAGTWALLGVLVAAGAWGSLASLPRLEATVPPELSLQEVLDPSFARVEMVSSQVPEVITRQIVQDGTGRIWFGTPEGLFHFDGESFHAFDEASGLPTGGHIPVLVDAKEHLWFGGLGGLHHFDGQRLRQVTPEPSWAIEEGADGTIWFGGESTLRRVRFGPPGLVTAESEPEIIEVGAVEGPVFDLFEDRDGVLWIATVGVAKLEDGRIRHLVAAPTPRDPVVPSASEQPPVERAKSPWRLQERAGGTSATGAWSSPAHIRFNPRRSR